MGKEIEIAASPFEVVGKRLRIVHCLGAWESFEKSLLSVTESKRISMKHRMSILVRRLADGERLSKDSFRSEGCLPSTGGKAAKRFYAFKKLPIRAYGWYSEVNTGSFFISHYICKKKDKLDSSDINALQYNWTRIEVNGDEK